MCSRLHVFQLSLFNSLSPRNCFFSLSASLTSLSLSHLSLSMNTDTPMDERFENLFSKVSIGDDAKNGPRSRVGVFGRRGFTRANSVLDSVRPKRRRANYSGHNMRVNSFCTFLNRCKEETKELFGEEKVLRDRLMECKIMRTNKRGEYESSLAKDNDRWHPSEEQSAILAVCSSSDKKGK